MNMKVLGRWAKERRHKFYSSTTEKERAKSILPMKTSKKQIAQQVNTNRIRYHARVGLKKLLALGL